MGPNKVDVGEEGEGDGGDDEQHGGREEEKNTRNTECSGRHGGLEEGARYRLDFISRDFIPRFNWQFVTSRKSVRGSHIRIRKRAPRWQPGIGSHVENAQIEVRGQGRTGQDRAREGGCTWS